jgi:uncharacterized protein (TIGR04141 family)
MATVTLYRISGADLSDDSVRSILPSAPRLVEVSLQRTIAARLFLARSKPKVPEWATYLTPIASRALDIPAQRTVGAVLLIKPDARHRLYAATWGNGHFLLRAERLEPDLGMRCALNLLSSSKNQRLPANRARVRSVRSKRVGQNTLITETQASRKAPIEMFPFRADVDQLRQVTGTPVDTDSWGATVTGGISIHVKRPDNPADLLDLCRAIERTYKSKDYREHYGWIDNVTQVRDPAMLRRAYQQCVGGLRETDGLALNLSPPSLISWEETASFEYRWGRHSLRIEEPSLDSFRAFLNDNGLMEDISAEALTDSVWLHGLDDAGERSVSWPIARCFSGDLTIGAGSYVLDDGILFAVDTDYLRTLNSYVQAVRQTRIPLPAALRGETEGTYNERVATAMAGALLLDKKTVRRPQATAIEICDIAFREKILLHVKKGVSSSPLSHLFAQGVVSAELLHMDRDFRMQVRALLRTRLQGSGSERMGDFNWLHAGEFDSQSCEVAYAIMTARPVPMTRDALPFFSKVNLRMRCEELRRMGFQHSLVLVATVQ